MTMLSFRVDDADAASTQSWAEQLGVDRSELLRDALRRHLQHLENERDARVWELRPLTAEESTLAAVADWGVAEDWTDWAAATDATR